MSVLGRWPHARRSDPRALGRYGGNSSSLFSYAVHRRRSPAWELYRPQHHLCRQYRCRLDGPPSLRWLRNIPFNRDMSVKSAGRRIICNLIRRRLPGDRCQSGMLCNVLNISRSPCAHAGQFCVFQHDCPIPGQSHFFTRRLPMFQSQIDRCVSGRPANHCVKSVAGVLVWRIPWRFNSIRSPAAHAQIVDWDQLAAERLSLFP